MPLILLLLGACLLPICSSSICIESMWKLTAITGYINLHLIGLPGDSSMSFAPMQECMPDKHHANPTVRKAVDRLVNPGVCFRVSTSDLQFLTAI